MLKNLSINGDDVLNYYLEKRIMSTILLISIESNIKREWVENP
jgi:hypothetical protein